MATGELVSQTAHPGYVGAGAWLAGSNEIVVATGGGEVLVLDPQQQRFTRRQQALTAEVFRLALSPGGDLVAACSTEGAVWIGRIADLSQVVTVQAHHTAARSVAWSPSGAQVATAGNDGAVRVWDLTGQCVGQHTDHEGPVSSVSYSPDGRLLASAGNDSTVRLWNLAEQRYERVLDRFERWWVWDVAFAPDGATIATIDQDPALALWRVADGQLLWRQRVPFGTNSLAWHPSESVVACAGGGNLQAWRLTGLSEGAAPPTTSGEVLVASRDAEETLPHLRTAADDPVALVRRAVVLAQSGRVAEAAELARAAAETGHPQGLYLMGNLAFRLGNWEEAVEWLLAAVGAGHPCAQEALDAVQRDTRFLELLAQHIAEVQEMLDLGQHDTP